MLNKTLAFIVVLLVSNSVNAKNANALTAPNNGMTFKQYSQVCESLTAEIPQLDSRKGVEIPITVNGKIPLDYLPNMNCDKPSLLEESCGQGQCIPYSRVQLLRDDEKVQMVALFRQKFIREPDSHQYDEIDLVVHSVTSGATCFFQATANSCDINSSLDGTKVPSPTAKDADKFWNPLSKVVSAGCGNCHDNDPFYYSPYIAQVIEQVPANPLGKYYFDIGPFSQWHKLESVSTRGNTCTGCHRIGNTFTCSAGLDQATGAHGSQPNADKLALSYPASHWMPPDNMWTKAQWDVTYKKAVQDLKDCCGSADEAKCIKEAIVRN